MSNCADLIILPAHSYSRNTYRHNVVDYRNRNLRRSRFECEDRYRQSRSSPSLGYRRSLEHRQLLARSSHLEWTRCFVPRSRSELFSSSMSLRGKMLTIILYQQSYTAIPYTERVPRPSNPLNRPAYQGRNPSELKTFTISVSPCRSIY